VSKGFLNPSSWIDAPLVAAIQGDAIQVVFTGTEFQYRATSLAHHSMLAIYPVFKMTGAKWISLVYTQYHQAPSPCWHCPMPATARPTQAHSHAGGPAGVKPKLDNPRHPERTLLYQTIAEHFETWFELASAGQFDGQGDHHTPKPYVRQAFRKYPACGIFAHGFTRARCNDCGRDYFVAYSCKGRGVCPSCNTRRMVETVAHLTDHVFSRLPVRQWVLSVPKRLRHFMQRDGAALSMVLRVIAQSLQSNCPGAAQVGKAALHIGAIAFIHRFGSSLNGHVHFHVCVVDGVFQEVALDVVADAELQPSPTGVIFHPASAIDATAVAQAQADLRRRILHAFVGRGLLESCDAKEMLAHQHSGFSVDGRCLDRSRRPRRPGAAVALLRPPALCHPPSQRGPPWSTAVPSSAASLALTSVTPRSTNCTSRRWN
jgi:DNA-directed RNA polymerase subunit RPC12/RpoP